MKKNNFCIRNYTYKDYHKFANFLIELSKISSEKNPSTQEVYERMNKPNYIAEEQVLLAEADGEIIGYLNMITELEIERVIFYMAVHPNFRRQGIGTNLLENAKRKAYEMGAKVIHVSVPEENMFSKEFFKANKFKEVRVFLEMASLLDKNIQYPVKDELIFRPLRKGEESKLTSTQNLCFEGSWGFKPNSEEEIRYMLSLPGCSLENVVGAFHGEELTAYCWNRKEKNISTGRINMVGVSPYHRGKGLGKKILDSGMLHLKKLGCKSVTLTVDSNNTAALNLYRKNGFAVSSRTYWFELS